jgi:adenylate cyclase
MAEQRKLAAILAADVVGYSRLTGADEERTLARLRALKSDLIDPTIAVHNGRVVKRTGDGALVEFRSVVDAIRCAIEVQNGMVERNAGLPADRRIEFRIGIHLGDVVEESDGDLMGDGVNIAARLEGVAQPGAICLSEDAYRQVKSRLDLVIRDLGETKLKNIAEPIRVYSLQVGSTAQAQPAVRSNPESSVGLALPDKPSVAVLPFTNMSGDAEQEYFADGIAEDIITGLARTKWLFVIARNSSFAYKGKSLDVKQVGHELGVRYVVEGSVRKAGNRVRITAQLVEANTGSHLWAERYDRELTDIFAVQDEITESVAAAIEPAMAHAERQRVSRKPPDSLDAWETYHRGLFHFLNQEPDENEQAKRFFQHAIDLDPGFAAGHYALALCSLWDGWVYALQPMEQCLSIARPLAQRALALDDTDSMSHFVFGFALHMSGDIQGGRNEYEKAISLNPNHAWAVGALGGLCCNDGRPDEAIAALNKAMRASPHDPLMWIWMLWVAATHFYARDFQAAVEVADRLIRFRPDKSNAYRFKAAALGHLGQLDEANRALKLAIETSPKNFDYFVRKCPAWMRSIDHALQVEGLRKAGLT